MLQISDENRVRTLTLDRPEALNAFNEALYEATAAAIRAAADDPEVAVLLLTGNGRAFSAGNDLKEMQTRITDPATGQHGQPLHIDDRRARPSSRSRSSAPSTGSGSASAQRFSAMPTWCSCRRKLG